MDCDRAQQLLPWHDRGSLDDEEARRVAAHLEECATCRGELERTRLAARTLAAHPPTPVLVDHGLGLETDVPRETIEAHLERCELCRDELALVRRSAERRDEPDPQVVVESAPRTVVAGGAGAWRGAAVAALLAVAVVGTGWWRTAGEAGRLEERLAAVEAGAAAVAAGEATANVVVRDLFLPGDVARGAATVEPQPLEVPDGASAVLLNVELPEAASGRAGLAVELVDAEGVPRLRLDGLRPADDPRRLTVLVPAHLVPAGGFTLRLLVGGEPVETYPVEPGPPAP